MMKLDIAGIHYEMDDDIKKYVNKKIGRLDRYVPRGASRSLHGEVKLMEDPKGDSKYTCEVVLHFTNAELAAKESTLNMYAAVDIVEAKLKNQLRKHKEKHRSHKSDRKGLLARFRRRADAEFRASQN